VKLLQLAERLQSLRDLLKEALCDGREQKGIAMTRLRGENGPGGGQNFAEAVLPEQFAQLREIGAGGPGRIGGWGGMHMRADKKGRTRPAPS